MTERCFTYGSLMCEDIMRAVCGHPCHGEDATLAGYSRHPVRNEDYPAIAPAPAGLVAGRLYHAIAPTAWERLDAFEGHYYVRELITVSLPDGRQVPAWTYVFRPEYRSLLLPGEWSFQDFLEGGKARFESRYLGFQQIQQ